MSKAARVGERLQKALELRGKSIRWLHQELEARGVENSGYSSVYRYVKGDVEPPLSILEEAAEVLDVLPLWLLTGQAEPTEEERRAKLREVFGEGGAAAAAAAGLSPPLEADVDFQVAQLVGPGEGATDTRKAILDGLMEGMGVSYNPPPPTLLNLEQVFWRRWHAQEEHLEEEDRLGVHELAETIGRAAVAPLRELGVEPAELERFELDYFLPLMFGPLAQAARRFGG